MKKITYLLLLIPFIFYSQNIFRGVVLEQNSKNAHLPLEGASVYWLNTKIGTTTNEDGKFSIPYKKKGKLIVSYIGFTTDTLTITKNKPIHHWLKPVNNLDEVVIQARKKTSATSIFRAENSINVSSDELLKAACCNLSESFETNPVIDVNFTDAVSGTKQIKMLGLNSPYISILTENLPYIRGAAQAYGLSYMPGTWVHSIQITKGAGSVVSGYESIAGEINVELQKPSTDKSIFVNGYLAKNGRAELNAHFNKKISEGWSTGVYLHGNKRDEKNDNNNDSFLDIPLTKQVNFFNRWQYTNSPKGLIAFLNLNYLEDNKQAGQLGFDKKSHKLTTIFWGSKVHTKRMGTSFKLGYVNPDIPYQSLGLQLAYNYHQQDSYFGLKTYAIKHKSAYSKIIYNSIISDTRNKIKTGVNFTHDNYAETVNNKIYNRIENNIGGFFEYSFDNLDDFSLTAGLRLDYHNLLGTFLTPRFHVRYSPWEKGSIRASFGKGKRAANIFTENQKMFISSREINILNSDGKIYGLLPETAWNYGFSLQQGFNLLGKKGEIVLDYYATHFKNKVLADWENPLAVSFYNVKNNSSAKSFQTELTYHLAKGLDIKTAYKLYSIKAAYKDGEKSKPLMPKHRFFANISYEGFKKRQSKWKFDTTFNWIGKQRFPSTANSLLAYKLPKQTPSFITLNAQVTKVFSKKLEVYVGGENITNTKQQNPIVSANNSFSPYFDATNVYGPIFGSNYYAGFRFKID